MDGRDIKSGEESMVIWVHSEGDRGRQVLFSLFSLLSLVFERHRLSTGGSERIQLTALLGAVKIAVQLAKN